MNVFTFHCCLLVPFSKFLENVNLSFICIYLTMYYYDNKEYKLILYTEKASTPRTFLVFLRAEYERSISPPKEY